VARRERRSPAKSAGTGTGTAGDGDGTASLRGARPWGAFAKKYFDAGWCPLPLPPRKKSSPPTGSTGRYEMPDKKKIAGWAKTRDARGNIALRVPDDILGIDVDAYGEKKGRAGLSELEKEFGPLPVTWTLTARSDGISGIRFFKVPAGLHWPGEPVPDVQIVQHHHRYAVAYPSVHPDTKGIYLWYAPGDALNGRPSVTVENEIPLVSDIDDLPESWVEGLTSGRLWSALPSDLNATKDDIADWLKARPAGSMCRLMRKQAQAAVEEIGVGGAHETLNNRIYSVISLAAEGHSGVSVALQTIRKAFYQEVTRPERKGRRSRQEAVNEFSRARDGAVRIMIASVADGEGALEDECGCAGNSLDWGERLGIAVEDPSSPAEGVRKRARMGKAKPPDKYTFDDSGNAEHLLDILDGAAHYVPGNKAWYFWNPKAGSWQADMVGSRALQAAQLVGKRCRELSDEYMERLRAAGSSLTLDTGGDVAQKIGQLDKHAKVSSDRKGLESMVKIAQAQDRAERAAEDFDRDRRLLACTNGTLVLGLNGIEFRKARREDLLTLSTGIPYDAAADSPAWRSYLARFIPDPVLQEYVQRISGYSLFGGNPERKMFFLQGGTSTGKSTFGRSLSAALGQLAGTMNLSLFRDSQDEKPRPDLVLSMMRRILVAYESSQEWHLHGDQIKRLTGGDPIKARILHSSVYVDRVPAFTPWVVTNSFPQVHGADVALHRRLVSVPFREAVAEGSEDLEVSARLDSVDGRMAILAWAVRGWELYREAGGLAAPEKVSEATLAMRDELSEFDRFLAENTVADPNGFVVSSDLFDRWEMWRADNHVREEMSTTKFGKLLAGRGYESAVKKVRGKTVRGRSGVSLLR
jgi:Zierdtviridae DNA primase